MKVIDLRSDTVTKPTVEMRAAMLAAEVGDDVYGEDPTVNRLEALAASMLGKEAAIFVCSGTQSNLLALLSHCERGDEYIVGQQGHTYKYEGGGAAVLGSIQPQPLDYLKQAHEFTRARGLALHLDGARVFNAAVHLKVPVTEISRYFDSVSVCLSKGLGAPVGSVLCASKPLIAKARRWRKVVGGGMRQAGVLAAAGIYALEHNIERLAQDHENAKALADGLSRIDGIKVAPAQTNMVYMTIEPQRSVRMREYLRDHGILISGQGTIRLVTHLDVDRRDVDRFVGAVRQSLAADAKAA